MELNGVWGTPALPQQQKLFLKMRDSTSIYPNSVTGDFNLQSGYFVTVWDKIPNRISSSCLSRGAPHIQFQEKFPKISNRKKNMGD